LNAQELRNISFFGLFNMCPYGKNLHDFFFTSDFDLHLMRYLYQLFGRPSLEIAVLVSNFHILYKIVTLFYFDLVKDEVVRFSKNKLTY